jgi:hypothetical protein
MPRRLRVAFPASGAYALAAAGAGYAFTGVAAALTYGGGPPISSGTPSPFTLTSATTGTLPFCVGHAFRQGDIPSGSGIAVAGATAQATIKNAWPDGSAKFAIIAGSYTSAGSAVTVTPSAGTASTGTALTTADLIATGITASIDAGAFGAASFGNTEWAAPFQSWVSGNLMSSWVYRKQIGSDAHLVAWLEVRLYLGGEVEVLPWVENGYINVASPSNRNATYTFTLGGSVRNGGQVIDLKHHQRTPLVAGSALSYWLAADPGVSVLHDRTYLMSTELVEAYWAVVPEGNARVAALASSYTPLAALNFVYDGDSMPSSGYQAPIGPFPEHEVLYLTGPASSAVALYGAVVRNAFAVGRWGIHYRDENTNRPPRPENYPTQGLRDFQGYKDNGGVSGPITPVATGGNPPTWDIAHSPNVGHLAYLLTGRFYFMEQTQFVAMTQYLGSSTVATQRNGSQGLFQPDIGSFQPRSVAWCLRALAQALSDTPDDDAAIRTSLQTMFHNNINHYYDRYVAQANSPIGRIQGDGAYGEGTRTISSWMDDFVTWAIGYAALLGLPLGAGYQAKLLAVAAWKGKGVVHRLDAANVTGWPYMNPAVYAERTGPGPSGGVEPSAARNLDWVTGTGPFYDAADAYTATVLSLPGGVGWVNPSVWRSSRQGTLSSESWPEVTPSMFQNMLPALSKCVRLGVAGALAGYQRIVGAMNFGRITANQNDRPVWAVKPASGHRPAWAANAPKDAWIAIPGTANPTGLALDSFCGWAYRADTGEIFVLAAGGHLDGSDNRVSSLDTMADAPAWVVRNTASPSITVDAEYNPDGKPSSRHTYATTWWVPSINRLMLIGCRFPYGPGVTTQDAVDGFNPDTNTWDAAGTYPNITPGYYGAGRDGSGNILSMWGRRLYTFPGGTVSGTTSASSATDIRSAWAYDSKRDRMFGLAWGDGEGFATGASPERRARLLNTASMDAAQLAVTFNASAALTQFDADGAFAGVGGSLLQYGHLDYDPVNDNYLYLSGIGSSAGRIYVIKPNATLVWDMSIATDGPGGVSLPQTAAGGLQNKLVYSPSLGGFLCMPTRTSTVYFRRTAPV